MNLAHQLYSAVMTVLTPLYLVRVWWRGRKEPLYRHAMLERLGHYPAKRGDFDIWLHSVSLGETRAAAALLDALRTLKPGLRLLLTHGTATGREAGAALLRDGDVQTWLPFDTPGATQRFFEHFRPPLGVLMETEVWPNLMLAAKRAQVTVLLANARLSEKSHRRGKRFAAVLRPAAQSLAAVLAQSEADAERIRESGAHSVEVVGNLKFDMQPDVSLVRRGNQWRSHLLSRSVLLAAATREGEEAALLNAWLKQPVQSRGLLLIVPRHPQRFDEVAALVRSHGLTLSRRSAWGDAPPSAAALGAQVWLGDSMGEMPLYYSLADVALLGGSFAPFGGQNLIEAAACGCPLVMGPHTYNFSQAAELALDAGAALRTADIIDGVSRACHLMNDLDARQACAKQGLAFASAHKGAAARMARRIESLMSMHTLSDARPFL